MTLVHTAYLALGTNLGDRMENLHRALVALPPTIRVAALSSVYETPPWGYADQPAFLNQVIHASTALLPLDLLGFLKRLEERLGRRPSVHNGPRLIDLDILLYDDLQIETPGLTIPHPRLSERAFVLVPLADLAPDLCSFGRLDQGRTHKLSSFNPAAYVHWEPEIHDYGAIWDANPGHDASQFPNEQEGIGRRHKQGAVITGFGGQVHFITFDTFQREQTAQTRPGLVRPRQPHR